MLRVNVQIGASRCIALPPCRVVPCLAFRTGHLASGLSGFDDRVSENRECVSHERLQLCFRAWHGIISVSSESPKNSFLSRDSIRAYTFHRMLFLFLLP